jgi:hypothetical protein
MSRLLLEDYRRLRQRMEPAGVGDDQAAQGRSKRSCDEETGAPGVARQREDPAGRRSLTGLEFRRQRST